MKSLYKTSILEIGLLIAIAIGIVLRIVNLDSREFWYDEVLSLLLSTGQKKLYSPPTDVSVTLADYKFLFSLPVEQSFSDVLATLENLLKGLAAEPHPPLFYLGQHFWLRLWGNSVAAMRSLPVLYSIGAIFASFGLGGKLLGYRGGLLLAAALSLNPFFWFHSLNVRMYCSLVFWVVVSGWATVELIALHRDSKIHRQMLKQNILWSIVLFCSVIGGFLTFYYFGFWLASLGILVISRDLLRSNSYRAFFQSRQWLQQSLIIFAGFCFTIPWLWWGTRQQFRNADLGRFKTGSNILVTVWKHLEGILTALASNLAIGDWISISPPWVIYLSGAIAFLILSLAIGYLWRSNNIELLLTTFCLSLLPLLLIVAVDVLTGKFTVGFGFGRSLILIVPGCLLLVVSAIVKLKPKWQTIAATALLAIYLITTVGDIALRERGMFAAVANIVEKTSNVPTLVVLNTKAWGHVLRLAYYLPEDPSIELLAQPAAKLPSALNKAIDLKPYQQLIVLDSDRPVWGRKTTSEEESQIEQVILSQYQLRLSQKLVGTWELDNFELNVYARK